MKSIIILCSIICSPVFATTAQEEADILLNEAAYFNITDVEKANAIVKARAGFNIISAKNNNDGRYIIVNIKEQYIRVYDNHTLILYEKVIVGKPSKPTKIFNEIVTGIVLSPQWSLPKRIADGYFPKMKKAGGWSGYTIYKDGKKNNIRNITRSDTYRIIQSPGPTNALGQFKFKTKHSKYSIFIHDTPNKKLFAQDDRVFSSGCIRMQNPIKLAMYLTGRTEPEIKTLLTKANNTHIAIKENIHMYIVDWSAWVNDFGEVIVK